MACECELIQKRGGWYYPTDPLFFGAQCKLEVIEKLPIQCPSDIAIQSIQARSPMGNTPPLLTTCVR